MDQRDIIDVTWWPFHNPPRRPMTPEERHYYNIGQLIGLVAATVILLVWSWSLHVALWVGAILGIIAACLRGERQLTPEQLEARKKRAMREEFRSIGR